MPGLSCLGSKQYMLTVHSTSCDPVLSKGLSVLVVQMPVAVVVVVVVVVVVLVVLGIEVEELPTVAVLDVDAVDVPAVGDTEGRPRISTAASFVTRGKAHFVSFSLRLVVCPDKTPSDRQLTVSTQH